MSKPALALGLLAVMAGAWYWALMPGSPRSSPHPGAAVATAAPARPGVPPVRLDRLSAPAIAPRATLDRDPFRSSPRDQAPPQDMGAARASTAGLAATPPPPSSPDWPRLELIGVAEAREDGRLVRTAIVSAPQGVLHARPGEVLVGVYRLERIAADGIDLRLLPEDRLLRLPLRR